MIYADFKSTLLPEDNGKQNTPTKFEQISKTCCLQLWL